MSEELARRQPAERVSGSASTEKEMRGALAEVQEMQDRLLVAIESIATDMGVLARALDPDVGTVGRIGREVRGLRRQLEGPQRRCRG